MPKQKQEIDIIEISYCLVAYDTDGSIVHSECKEANEVRFVMSPEQILYRDALNRENTATRMHMRMLSELSKQNGSN